MALMARNGHLDAIAAICYDTTRCIYTALSSTIQDSCIFILEPLWHGMRLGVSTSQPLSHAISRDVNNGRLCFLPNLTSPPYLTCLINCLQNSIVRSSRLTDSSIYPFPQPNASSSPQHHLYPPGE